MWLISLACPQFSTYFRRENSIFSRRGPRSRSRSPRNRGRMIFSRGRATSRGEYQEAPQQEERQNRQNQANNPDNSTYQAGMQKDINYPTLPRPEPPSAPHQASKSQAPTVAPKPDLLTIWHKLREERDTFPKNSEKETEDPNREQEVVAQIQRWSVEMKRRQLPKAENFKLQMKPKTEGLSEEEERVQWEHFQDLNRKRRASWSPPNNRKLVHTERSPLNRQNSFKPQSTVMDLQMPIPMKPLFSRLPSPPSHRRKT